MPIPLILGLGGAWWGGAGLTRSYQGSAAREIAGRLDGSPIVDVHARPGLPMLWGECGTVTIRARDFETPVLPFRTEGWRSKYGRLTRLVLDLREFRMAGLAVESLVGEIPRCRFDLGLATAKRIFRISRSGVGTGTVTIRAEALAEFARRKFPFVPELSLTLNEDRFEATGRLRILGEQRFRATGALYADDGTRLRVRDVTLELDGKPAPQFAEAFRARFDPVVDLQTDLGLDGALRVRDLRLQNDRLIASGPLILPEAVRPETTRREMKRT